MAVGLPSKVIEPTAASSPAWVQHLVNWAGTSWSYHPSRLGRRPCGSRWASASGSLWRPTAGGPAPPGWPAWAGGWWSGSSASRSAGIFAPGLTWMFGAPGAALFYSAAGALIALPGDRVAYSPAGPGHPGRDGCLLRGDGGASGLAGAGFLAGDRARQARHAGRHDPFHGPDLAATSLSALINAFTTFDEAHGFAVNLFVVAALALIGLALLTAWRPALFLAVTALAVLCLADWVLVQDMGIFGGLGTDPNSMVPITLVVIGGYLALTRLPAPVAEPAATQSADSARRGRRARRRAARVAGTSSPRRAASVAGDRHRWLRCLGRRPGRRPAGGRADGGSPGQPQRGADPGPVTRRFRRAAELPGQGIPADGPARPHRHAGEPARQGGAADLPGPGVHECLPADRAGVPRGRPDPGRVGPSGRIGGDRHQPGVLPARPTPRTSPARRA